MPLRVKVIVEGQGEENAIRPLLERIWYELLGVVQDTINILKPFRQPQGTLLKEEGLRKAVEAAKIQLGPDAPGSPRGLVLILIDSERRGCPKDLAPKLLQWGREARSDADIACVLPNPMFETWFAAAASSLADVYDLPADLNTPDDPEGNRLGKSWFKKQLPRGRGYNGPRDQPKYVTKMGLALCRKNSPSFDKLCRELERRKAPTSQHSPQPD